MLPTTINGRWELLLPEHRARRAEWPIWEQERLASMHANLSAEDVVFDIGAEEGDLPALWASWGCHVVMVEPNPRVWPNIAAVFEANRVVTRARACYVGFAGAEPRHGDPASAGAAGLHVDAWPPCADGPVIGDHGFCVIVERPDLPVTTIDLLAARVGMPDAITIDVEGAELQVLRGAEWVLRSARPLVWVSIHTGDLAWMAEKFPGEGAEELHAYMAGLGYTGVHLATDHEEHWGFYPPTGRVLKPATP